MNKISDKMAYFKHFTWYFDSKETKIVRAEFGLEGYAVQFYLFERMADKIDEDFILDSRTKKVFCSDLNIDENKFNKILSLFCELGIIDSKKYEDEGILYNKDIQDTKDQVKDLRKAKRESMQKRRKKNVVVNNEQEIVDINNQNINRNNNERKNTDLISIYNSLRSKGFTDEDIELLTKDTGEY